MRIAVVGTGRVGTALASLWTKAGHDICFGSRTPEAHAAAEIPACSVLAAVSSADVVVLAIPFAAVFELAADIKKALRGKIVIDCTNPLVHGDGDRAEEVLEIGKGSGVATARELAGAQVVKAFNTLPYDAIMAGRDNGKRLAVPLAGSNDAVATVSRLVASLGMEAVPVGPLEASILIDPETDVWNAELNADELRRALFRRPAPDGDIRVYASRLIDDDVFVHGFPERTGGLSKGLRSSLNVGYRWGDDIRVVEANRRLVAEFVGYRPSSLVVTKHVHGNRVWIVGSRLPDPAEYDGLVSDQPGVVLAAFAADCVPIVFADAEARVCGAVHAGWRGTVARAAVCVVDAMCKLGATREGIVAALGPCIGVCCFEVGEEVVDEFRAAFGDVTGLIVDGPRKQHVDLRIANRAQLEEVGVRPEAIDDGPPCTKCHAERFFSYRRDGILGGVHMGLIGLREPA